MQYWDVAIIACITNMDSGNVRFKMAKQKTVDACEMKMKESNCVTIHELFTKCGLLIMDTWLNSWCVWFNDTRTRTVKQKYSKQRPKKTFSSKCSFVHSFGLLHLAQAHNNHYINNHRI